MTPNAPPIERERRCVVNPEPRYKNVRAVVATCSTVEKVDPVVVRCTERERCGSIASMRRGSGSAPEHVTWTSQVGSGGHGHTTRGKGDVAEDSAGKWDKVNRNYTHLEEVHRMKDYGTGCPDMGEKSQTLPKDPDRRTDPDYSARGRWL
ncbi:hypothetical protein EDB84DRAFT_1436633 [Lactarius hengduanensis]|nr:hypothetical protein EDB84DRAFT_1436633 [Lactarius hengduanensis]